MKNLSQEILNECEKKLNEANSPIYGFREFQEDELYYSEAMTHALDLINGLKEYFEGLVAAVDESPISFQAIRDKNAMENIPKLLDEVLANMNKMSE